MLSFAAANRTQRWVVRDQATDGGESGRLAKRVECLRSFIDRESLKEKPKVREGCEKGPVSAADWKWGRVSWLSCGKDRMTTAAVAETTYWKWCRILNFNDNLSLFTDQMFRVHLTIDSRTSLYFPDLGQNFEPCSDFVYWHIFYKNNSIIRPM